MKIKLFTHSDLDGIGCAILMKYLYKDNELDIEYCDYGNVNDKIKNFLNSNFSVYDKIFITDISVDEEVANLIDSLSNIIQFTLLDHHKTAGWLNKFSWAKVEEFDSLINRKTSGTLMLFRELFDLFQDQKLEDGTLYCKNSIYAFVNLVNNYDTWYWKEVGNDNPKKLNDLLYLYGRYLFIDKMLLSLVSESSTMTQEDLFILNIRQAEIDRYIEKKNKNIIKIELKGLNVGVVFAENYISEVGNKLCELNPDLDLVALVNMDYSVSYRTIKENVDVSEFAKIFDGGGHKKSSGSPIDKYVKDSVIEELFWKGY